MQDIVTACSTRRFSIMASEIKVDTIVNAGGDNDTGIDLATNDQISLI